MPEEKMDPKSLYYVTVSLLDEMGEEECYQFYTNIVRHCLLAAARKGRAGIAVVESYQKLCDFVAEEVKGFPAELALEIKREAFAEGGTHGCNECLLCTLAAEAERRETEELKQAAGSVN